MKGWKRFLDGLHPHLLAWIWAALLLLQMVLAFFVFTEPKSPGLRIAGWVLWALGSVYPWQKETAADLPTMRGTGDELWLDERRPFFSEVRRFVFFNWLSSSRTELVDTLNSLASSLKYDRAFGLKNKRINSLIRVFDAISPARRLSNVNLFFE